MARQSPGFNPALETMITKIISGGQTGADRGGLDVAIRHGIPHGGWCPKGRKAEDGVIPDNYLLEETSSAVLQRIGRNVRDSDGTVVFTLASTTGGLRRTIDLAASFGKPWLHLAKSGTDDPAVMLQHFVTANSIQCLNVAGTQESEEPGIYLWVSGVIETAFWSPGNAGLP